MNLQLFINIRNFMAVLWDVQNNILTDLGSFRTKWKLTNDTNNDACISNVEIAALLKDLSNPWKSPEMLLINSEINLIWTWSESFIISDASGQQHLK